MHYFGTLTVTLVQLFGCALSLAELIDLDDQLESTNGRIWPLPFAEVRSETFYRLDPKNFKILLTEPKLEKCEILCKAIERYQKLFFLDNCAQQFQPKDNITDINVQREGGFHERNLYNLTIRVGQKCEHQPHPEMAEMYTLRINTEDYPNEAFLFSNSVWGILRGLESFSQLIWKKDGAFFINGTFIMDKPRYRFRGLLLDTSRHYIPLPLILDNIDAMAYTKLNVFHWHIVDDQSFPYVSERFPNLSKKGAFSKQRVYTRKDIRDVIEYARLRGIRVMVEFDTPGHSLSWGKGQPDLLTQCFSKGNATGTFGPIDPSNSDNYIFLEQLFEEVTQLFSDQYFHIGGDEVDFECWKSNENITKFMQQHGLAGNYVGLESYHVNNVVEITRKLKKTGVVWQEVFDNGAQLLKSVIVHVWKFNDYKQELSKVTRHGFKTILSSPWYLNKISYGPDWRKFYDVDPDDFSGSEEQRRLLLGGEACIWTEYIDSANLISRTWPRAAAVAERLWSDRSVKGWEQAVHRFRRNRCLLLKRGIRAEPSDGPGFCECDLLA